MKKAPLFTLSLIILTANLCAVHSFAFPPAKKPPFKERCLDWLYKVRCKTSFRLWKTWGELRYGKGIVDITYSPYSGQQVWVPGVSFIVGGYHLKRGACSLDLGGHPLYAYIEGLSSDGQNVTVSYWDEKGKNVEVDVAVSQIGPPKLAILSSANVAALFRSDPERVITDEEKEKAKEKNFKVFFNDVPVHGVPLFGYGNGVLALNRGSGRFTIVIDAKGEIVWLTKFQEDLIAFKAEEGFLIMAVDWPGEQLPVERTSSSYFTVRLEKRIDAYYYTATQQEVMRDLVTRVNQQLGNP